MPSTTSTPIQPSTSTTLSPEELAAAEYESDVDAIQQLWRGYSDAWLGGKEAAIAYKVAHTHPALECSVEDYEAWYAATGEGFLEEWVVDAASVERDDGWAIHSGPASGQVPEGRIYILTVTGTTSDTGITPLVETSEVHSTVNDTGAYFFFPCSGNIDTG